MKINIDSLLTNMPKFKLSYDNLIHKKVNDYDYCLAIPKGRKFLAWFTYYEDKNICIFLEINRKKEILSYKYFPLCFDSKLSPNTILYGTITEINSIYFYCIEDIYYYRNYFVNNLKFNKKMEIFQDLFNSIKNLPGTKIKFTLSIINTNTDNLLNQICNIPYPIFCIKYITNNGNFNYLQKETFKQSIKTFLVKPGLQNDIYLLYCNNNDGNLELYSKADVPSYKISVLLNSLFRNIKENINLDTLEESDSEDEFENINEDKFVFLNREYKMNCLFNNNTKRWYPFEISNNDICCKNHII